MATVDDSEEHDGRARHFSQSKILRVRLQRGRSAAHANRKKTNDVARALPVKSIELCKAEQQQVGVDARQLDPADSQSRWFDEAIPAAAEREIDTLKERWQSKAFDESYG